MHNDQHNFEQFRENTTMTTHALVLGGEGIVGAVWEAGLLVELAEGHRIYRRLPNNTADRSVAFIPLDIADIAINA